MILLIIQIPRYQSHGAQWTLNTLTMHTNLLLFLTHQSYAEPK